MEKRLGKHAVPLFLLAVAVYAAVVVLPVFLWLENLDIIETLRNISVVITFVAIGLYTAAAFLSITGKSRDNKKVDMKQQSQFFDNTYEYARRAKAKYGNKMRRAYVFTVIYMFTALLLFYIASVAALLFHIAMLPVSAIFFLVVFNALARIAGKKKRIPDSIPLDPVKFPVMYGISGRCAYKLGINTRKVRLDAIEEDNASVAIYGGAVHVSLGYNLIAFCSEEELENVILHELAHVKHSDTKRSRRYRRTGSWLSAIFGRRMVISAEKPVFYWLASRYINFAELYSAASSLGVEIAADEEVKASGSAQPYINACAKLVCFNEFVKQMPLFNAYFPEEPADNYFELCSKAFANSYKRYGHEWAYICRSSLPFRRPTHPTLPERITFFGVNDIGLDFAPGVSDGFAAERSAVIAEIDKKYHKILSKNYEHKRKANYLHYKEIADAPAADDASDYDILSAAMACERLCMYAHALALYTHVLERTPDCALAQLRKGILLLSSYDDTGLAFVISATNARLDYAEQGTETVMDYILRRGLTGRLEECRQWSTDILQKKIDISYNYSQYKGRDRIEPNTVRQSTKELLVRFAQKREFISGIYAADKVSPDGFRLSYIGIMFKRRSFDADCVIAFKDINFLLDTTREGDKYEVAIFNLNPAMAHAFIETPQSKLYSDGDKDLDPFA